MPSFIYTYRPMLKTKAGEATALRNLQATEKDRIAPIFHVSERPPTTFASRLAQAWVSRLCFLDGAFNFNVTGQSNDFDNTFNALVAGGMLVVPVVEIGAAHGYNTAAFAHVNKTAIAGLMLKCTPNNLSSAATYAQQLNVPIAQIDLLIDAGHVAEFDPASFAGYISQVLQSQLPPLPWRSVTLASSAAPKDFGQLGLGTTDVRRSDWLLWKNINQPSTRVDFGDFGISHRDLTEPPGVAMAGATVSVRYTIDDNWVMIKGRRTSGTSGIPMPQQYRAHAQTLAARSDFAGLPLCWADQRIAAIAAGTSTPGGRAQWVEIGANRHFTFIVNRLP